MFCESNIKIQCEDGIVVMVDSSILNESKLLSHAFSIIDKNSMVTVNDVEAEVMERVNQFYAHFKEAEKKIAQTMRFDAIIPTKNDPVYNFVANFTELELFELINGFNCIDASRILDYLLCIILAMGNDSNTDDQPKVNQVYDDDSSDDE